MNLMKIRWYGPEFKTLYERGQVKKLLKEYCGECDEKFFVFGMIYNAPIKENYGFFVGNQLRNHHKYNLHALQLQMHQAPSQNNEIKTLIFWGNCLYLCALG